MNGFADRRGAIRLAGRLMLGAFAGKVLGFAREIEMARLLGAGLVADAFRASLTAAILPIAPLVGDIVPSVMIPMHRQWSADGSAPRRFALLTLAFGLLTLPIAIAAFIFADQWVAKALTVRFVKVMVLSMPGVVLASCFNSAEISIGRSRIAMIRASMQNLSVMAGIGLMVLTGNVMLIAWAFTVSMTATAVYGGAMLVRERELTLGGASLREAGAVVAAFIHRIKSLLITPFADQGNILLERTLVSHVGVGSVASMEYARTLTDTALFLVSQPIGFVMLAQTTGDRETTGHRVELLLRPLLALSLPAALFMMIFATDIVTVVLRRGAFQEHAVTLTSAALGGISAGLWAAVIGSVFIRMLNAAHRNRMAAVILLVGAAGQALVNVLAVRDLGVLGAGLGDSTRGLVMLIGAAWALHSGRLLLRLLMLMVIPAVLFVAMGEGIRAVVVSPFTRLILGGGSFGVGILLCLLMLAPEFCRMVMQRLRVRRLRAQT